MSFYMKGITMFYLDNQVNLPWWAIALIVFASILIVLAIIALIISKARHEPFWPTYGNVTWLTFVGWELALISFIWAIICFVSIIFIPVGIQYLKVARLAFWPFGYSPRFRSLNGFKLAINIIWIIVAGWEQALVCFIAGAICCATIVLWPSGLQLFKFGRLVLMPLGSEIVKDN